MKKMDKRTITCESKFLRSCGYLVAAIVIVVSVIMVSSKAQNVDAKVLVNTVSFRRLPPKEFAAVQGSNVIIECEAASSPPPTVRWLKDGKLIHQGESDNIVDEGNVQPGSSINLSATRSRLYLDCVDATDEAIYTCVAENAYSKISSTTKLNVVDLSPAENIESTIEIGSGTSSSSSSSDLKSSSSSSSVESSSPSSTLGLMPIAQCSKSQQVGPRIHMWTHNIIELFDNDIQLYCRSNKVKQPLGATTHNHHQQHIAKFNNKYTKNVDEISQMFTVTWTGPDDKPILPDQQTYKYEITDSGDLIIHNLKWSDMGSYMCTVSDEQDNRDSVTTFVYPTTSKKAERERVARRLKTNNIT